MYGSMKTYLSRKKGYRRINESGRRRMNQVRLGTNQKKKRFWRIKIKPKLRLKPKKFFCWLRDSYVNMMLGFARSRVVTSGYGGPRPEAIGWFGNRPFKEYDEKMVIEIYKSIVMERGGQLVPQNNSAAGKTSFGPIVKLASIAEC
ncbi:hypothetical protein K2173_010245 [Erythroxylum novogranatense]|uniref:Uncharacterized protein n=1 Tax=Erythroxylum novogranatense TaxID=1862640 RepID=A0AAV8UD07_9ROSI|nr:hypothetical protein K2173_010245 [Erythroxylum novogranatense]